MTDEERKIKRSRPNAKIVSCFHIRFVDAWPGISANCCINLADILELQELAPTLDITFGLFHYHITIIHWNQLKFRHVRPIYSSLVTFSKRPYFTQNWSIIFDDFFIIFYSFYCAQFHIYRFINGRTKINIRQ